MRDESIDPVALFRQMVSEGDVLPERLEQIVAATPDRPYIYYGEEARSLSYAQFYGEASRLAASLQRLGVGPDDRVAVFTRNSLVASLSMFASWLAGAVYCPVNFLYRGKLLAYQLRDTAPRLLLSDVNLAAALVEVADHLPADVILHEPRPGDHDCDSVGTPSVLGKSRVAILADCLAGGGHHSRVGRLHSDAASIVYTSGTTGAPKGVVLPFRWINQYSFIYRKLFDANDVIYCDLPLYHVGGAFFRVAKAAYVGARVALYDRFSPSNFWARIHESGATHVTLLDVMIPWLMSAPPGSGDRDNTVVKAHMQPLPLHHHAVAQRFGIDLVTAGFGQTESGSSFLALIDEFPDGQGTPPRMWQGPGKEALLAAARRLGVLITRGDQPLSKGFIGTSSPLFDTAILDADDEHCAVGEVGQLALRPRFPHLTLKEYFNKPQATLEASRNFWFHTGDACYRRADGVHFFVDRLGGYFRVRGENVSSYQVEDLLNEHPKIRACAAVPVPAREGDEEDCAVFIQLVEGASMTADELLTYAGQNMPRYMVPVHVRFLDALPVTPTNKVEKYKLKESLLAELRQRAVDQST